MQSAACTGSAQCDRTHPLQWLHAMHESACPAHVCTISHTCILHPLGGTNCRSSSCAHCCCSYPLCQEAQLAASAPQPRPPPTLLVLAGATCISSPRLPTKYPGPAAAAPAAPYCSPAWRVNLNLGLSLAPAAEPFLHLTICPPPLLLLLLLASRARQAEPHQQQSTQEHGAPLSPCCACCSPALRVSLNLHQQHSPALRPNPCCCCLLNAPLPGVRSNTCAAHVPTALRPGV
jgi:hypothetical protein